MSPLRYGSSAPRTMANAQPEILSLPIGSCCDLKSFSLNAAQHAAENDMVERHHHVPVEQPEQPSGFEQGELLQSALLAIPRLDAKLEQSFSWQFHLGAKRQAPIAIQSDDAPEIERLSITYSSGSRRPRRSPGPPTTMSIQPRILHSQSAPYQPCPPPTRQTALNAAQSGAFMVLFRRSRKTAPPAQFGSPAIEPAIDQFVSTSCSAI